ncbi:MAG: hypothetical protein IKR76_06280 [Ruminococcus sp.]|nr:hypothetical protein [Ruminococcus sp.]
MKRLVTLLALTAALLCSCGSSGSSDSEYFSKKRAIEAGSSQSGSPGSSADDGSTTQQSTTGDNNESSSHDEQEKEWAGFDEFFQSLDESSRTAKNYAYNRDVWDKGGIQGQLIEAGQDTPPQNDLQLGNYKLGYNGCEVIASYNLLTLLGLDADMPKLIAEFEQNALIASDGSLGSEPRKIYLLLDKCGISYETLKSPADCDKALESGKSLIFAFYTGTPYFSGIHTVCITGGEEKYVLNRYNDSESKKLIDSVNDLLKEDKCLIVAYAVSTNN